MFKDIGYKIETVASVVCWIGIIACVFIGLTLAINFDKIILGIIVALGGSLVSWLSTFLMYGFGTLIRTNEEMNYKFDKLKETNERQQQLISVLVKLTREQKRQE